MKIKVTLGQNNDVIQDQNNVFSTDYSSKQIVSFLYLTELKDIKEKKYEAPSKKEYVDFVEKENGLAILNYNDDSRINKKVFNNKQYGISTVKRNDYINAISVYKKEIWYKKDGYKKDDNGRLILDSNGNAIPNLIEVEENGYSLVSDMVTNGKIIDYNISNNRYYKYLYRFIYSGEGSELSLTEGMKEIVIPISVRWWGWSLTELHEQMDTNGNIYYTASLKDVWKFKNNVNPGDTTHTLSKNQQDTLAKFPRFFNGQKNSLSGTVNCLLGRDVLPYDIDTLTYEYTKDGNDWKWSAYNSNSSKNIGGYTEKLWDDVYYSDETSNKSVDMLNRWREFCFSGNPKLFKDNKGQSFIVQIHDPSDKIENGWSKSPITINFSWTQIGDTKNIVIIGGE